MKSKPTLLFCLFMDIMGSASYIVPVLGDWYDLAWAPISAFIFYKSFGGKTGRLGAILNFVEELLPFTDIIPTFTLGYFYNRFTKKI